MADFMYSDNHYHYFGSQKNNRATRTLITAKDSNGKLTFKSESKGKLTGSAINKILKAWCVNPDKEHVEIQHI